ncbi:MAG: 30S ribosomal protein S17e [Candidatus Bathyarchaeia archaeon]
MEEPAYLGKVKTEHIKRLAKELMNRFPDKFSTNFEDNKRAVDTLTRGATTRVRNQIAGYITHAMILKRAVQSTETEEEIAA